MNEAVEITQATIAVAVILSGATQAASTYSKAMRERVPWGFRAFFFTLGAFTFYAGVNLFPA
jgi:hypothetical protein